MKKIIGVSEAASLAIHAMIILASEPDRVFSTRQLASILDASSHHLAKIMQRLQRCGFVRSVRGPAGGFSAAENWRELRFMDVYEAMDGPWEPQDCLLAKSVCGDQGRCPLSRLIRNVNSQLENFLKETTLSDIADTFTIHKNRRK